MLNKYICVEFIYTSYEDAPFWAVARVYDGFELSLVTFDPSPPVDLSRGYLLGGRGCPYMAPAYAQVCEIVNKYIWVEFAYKSCQDAHFWTQ